MLPFLLLFWLPASLAQAAPSHGSGEGGTDSAGWTMLPLFNYTPETQLGLGGFAARFFRMGDPDPESRPSSFAAIALATTRRQLIVELIPELYWDNDRVRLWPKVDYRIYPNAFWGIGPKTRDSAKEWYQENGPRVRVYLRRLVAGSLYIEGKLDAQFVRIRNQEPGGLLAGGTVPGADAVRVVGLGPSVAWDSRDHILAPHRGAFHEISVLQFHRVLFSQFTFNQIETNLRSYVPLAKGHTLAIQVYGALALGLVPFHRMPMLGGQWLLRGYFEGRYRDRALVMSQAEYRMPLFWRLGAVAFAGFGEVASTVTQFHFTPFKWSLGGGLRFRLSDKERLNLRTDMAFGYDTWGAYVGIAEAF